MQERGPPVQQISPRVPSSFRELAWRLQDRRKGILPFGEAGSASVMEGTV